MDGAVDSPATEQTGIRRVHDGVDRLLCYVPADNLDRPRHHRSTAGDRFDARADVEDVDERDHRTGDTEQGQRQIRKEAGK